MHVIKMNMNPLPNSLNIMAGLGKKNHNFLRDILVITLSYKVSLVHYVIT